MRAILILSFAGIAVGACAARPSPSAYQQQVWDAEKREAQFERDQQAAEPERKRQERENQKQARKELSDRMIAETGQNLDTIPVLRSPKELCMGPPGWQNRQLDDTEKEPFNRCIDQEQVAYDYAKMVWPSLTRQERAFCESEGWMASYGVFAECVHEQGVHHLPMEEFQR